jgi:hypothetical protein
MTAVQRAAAIKLRLTPGAVGSAGQTITAAGTAQDVAETEGVLAGGKEEGKQEVKRSQEIISKGLAAADSTAAIRRGIQLIEGIQTGGVGRVQLAAKRFFGVESADEGELSNLMGKAVLSQLRDTFGAAFTAQEGKSLQTIEANLSKSPAANKRLLQNALRIAERSAKRGIDRAVKAKDFDTAADIQASLDFVLSDIDEEEAAPAAPAPQEDRGEGQIMIDANGNRARVFADGTFEEL